MHERLPTFGRDGRLWDDPFGVLAVVSVLLLCVLVTAVGAVAVVAQALGSWQALFYMEQVFAVSVPTVKGLMGLSVGASFVSILRR